MRIIGAAAFALSVFVTPGLAADPRNPSATLSEFDWTGFYLGAQAGGAKGQQKRLNTIFGIVTPYTSNGFTGAFHGGYLYQFGRFVVGAEGEIGYGSVKGNDGNVGGTLDQTRLGMQGALRARLGYSFGRIMVFAAGGWAFASAEHSNDGGGFVTDVFTRTLNGWTLGGGAEYALTDTLLLRAEYRYSDLGNYTRQFPANFVAPYKVSNREQAIRLGLSYKFGGSGYASAASQPVRAAAQPRWTGFYAGVQAGYALSALTSTVFIVEAGRKFDGFVGGGHVGYNYRIRNVVLGAEADAEWSTAGGLADGFNFIALEARLKSRWQTSLRARAGYSFNQFLFYATGGLAIAEFGFGGGPIFGPLQLYSKTLTGYTVGGGIEYAITRAISARVEYRYTDFRSASADLGPLYPGVPQRNAISTKTVRGGMSYHF